MRRLGLHEVSTREFRLLQLVSGQVIRHDGRQYFPIRSPDGDNGWTTEWYVWVRHLDKWEFVENPPGEVVQEYNPYL